MASPWHAADDVKEANNHNSKVTLGWDDIKKGLFCNAHVLLTIDEAIVTDFTLKTKVNAGISKIISTDAGVFYTSLSSIFSHRIDCIM